MCVLTGGIEGPSCRAAQERVAGGAADISLLAVGLLHAFDRYAFDRTARRLRRFALCSTAIVVLM